MERNPGGTTCKVLVLDGQSKAAAEAVLALPRHCEIHVAASDRRCAAFASARVSERLSQPQNAAELRRWIEARDEVCDYHLIIPGSEASLVAIKGQNVDSRLRAKFVIPDESSIDVTLDQQRTVDMAERLGIPVPQSTLILDTDDVPRAPGFPTVIKALHSTIALRGRPRGLSARVCANEMERDAALAALLPYTAVVEQDYFRGRAIGVCVLFDSGKLRWLFGRERIHELPLTGGASTYRRSIDVPAALGDAAIKLLTHLNWHGLAMVEFNLAGDGRFRLIEVDARLGDSLAVATASGMNFLAALLDLALRRPVSLLPDYRTGYYMRDVVGDLGWFVQSLRDWRKPLLLKRISLGDFAGLARPLVALEGWDLFRWREPGVWLGSLGHALGRVYARIATRVRMRNALRESTRNWQAILPAWRAGRIRRVLVLCTGNICRSPAVAQLLGKALPAVEVRSAGFYPLPDRACPRNWAAVVREVLGLDLAAHRSTVVDGTLLEWAELVLIMDARNWRELRFTADVPSGCGVLLGVAATDIQSGDSELRDPFERDERTMRDVAERIGDLVALLARQWHSSAKRSP